MKEAFLQAAVSQVRQASDEATTEGFRKGLDVLCDSVLGSVVTGSDADQ